MAKKKLIKKVVVNVGGLTSEVEFDFLAPLDKLIEDMKEKLRKQKEADNAKERS